MSIKLTLLKSGEQLISDMKELVAEGQNQPHAYLLDNPHTIDINHKEFMRNNRLGIEFTFPVYQKLRGIQMSDSLNSIIGWQYSF